MLEKDMVFGMYSVDSESEKTLDIKHIDSILQKFELPGVNEIVDFDRILA